MMNYTSKPLKKENNYNADKKIRYTLKLKIKKKNKIILNNKNLTVYLIHNYF